MFALGLASTIASQFDALASHGKSHQLQQGFQQLAQDLQSGDLSQAQNDFASLQQLLPSNPQNFAVASAPQTSNPLANAVSQLAKDLQSGNVNAAQSDLATVRQVVPQLGQSKSAGHAHHHQQHHGGSGDASQSSARQNDIFTLFGQLGQNLQVGNLSAAQQAYASLQQDFLLSGLNGSSAFAIPATSNLSLSA